MEPTAAATIFSNGYAAGVAGHARAANSQRTDSDEAAVWSNGWAKGNATRALNLTLPGQPNLRPVAITHDPNRTANRFQGIGAGSGLALGLFVLSGYAVSFEVAWRLTPGLPAAHPLSALCITLLGFGLLVSLSTWSIARFAARSAVVMAVVIVAVRLLVPWIGTSIFDAVTPFHSVLVSQAAAKTPVFMGSNTAHTLLAIAISEILRWKRWGTASQLVACSAMGLLCLALIGYIDHLASFYGGMAPVSLLGCFFLSLSILSGTHQQGFIRPLVAHSEPGNLARLLLCSSTLVIIFIGWGMTHYPGIFKTTQQARVLLAYQTAAIIILSWVLVTVITVRADVIDGRRRSAESLLLAANRQLEDLASRDPLTGLANRRRFEEVLQTEHRRAERSVSPLSLIAIDVDHFKPYNDTYGHPAGDACLAALAAAIEGAIRRPGDLAARVGGEEFSVLLPVTDAIGAAFMATSISNAVLELALPHIESPSGFVTISVGVATVLPLDESSLTMLVKAADVALYAAKQGGRNAIRIAPIFTPNNPP